jgi:hypothetical protein
MAKISDLTNAHVSNTQVTANASELTCNSQHQTTKIDTQTPGIRIKRTPITAGKASTQTSKRREPRRPVSGELVSIQNITEEGIFEISTKIGKIQW